MPKQSIKTPTLAKKAKVFNNHGDTRTDNYYWLNDRENPEVIAYLNAENTYYDTLTAHTKDFQKDLFEEMKARIKKDDESVPYKKNGYYYITRYVKGGQYPIYSRKKENLKADEEILFDVNKMAKGFDYYQLGGLSISTNNRYVAFAVDTVSRRQYNIQIKDLKTGEVFPEIIKNTTGGCVWANDNKTLFYTQKNPTTLRSEKIFKHVLGTDTSTDVEIFHEKDDTFGVFVTKSKSDAYIFIGSYSTLSTEYQYLDASQPNKKFTLFQARERDLEYNLSHYKEHFYILTNKDKATNFKLMKTSVKTTSKENWTDVIPHRTAVLLEDFTIFKDYMVLEERNNGLNKIRIKRWDNKGDYYLPFKEETYAANVYSNPEFDTETLRYSYNSLTTPASVIDFNMKDKTFEIKKEQEVLGGKFDKNNYTSQRLWATARDGKKVAISMVHHKDTKLTKDTPILLYAYGSYGYTIDPRFSTTRLSLLDRGFVYATAHIRGSEYLGRQWYEDGKLLHKKNTFTDFIDCGKFLIEKNYTSSEHLYAEGGSAGGLLMGAIVNMSPQTFKGIIAAVPFVDVVTTMLDDSIPLTTGEYDEWGNPNDKEYYDYIKSYSPYDNVVAQDYPNMLVTTGLHDSQVQYFEPAKWVAKLREFKTDNNQLLLYTNMEAGHGGASGRFDALKEVAREQAFLLDLEGIND
ncbi:MAG TPA: S9 family peptidase [Lutibacter sp.]|nr:S9 family peptidase [Lutibacter sp.]